MGGLRKKMPITFWTFLIGGLALSGLPFFTAGFWSKDEIFAEAWYLWEQDGAILPLIVFIMLAVAAFLTAYYTARQISLTFFGESRTPLAENAHESNYFMTIPLILLAVFAVIAGWAGIPLKPEEFYQAGSWGPATADALLAQSGHAWREPQPLERGDRRE